MGHARAQAVTRPLFTAEAGVQTHPSKWDFFLVLLFSLSVLSHQYSISSHLYTTDAMQSRQLGASLINALARAHTRTHTHTHEAFALVEREQLNNVRENKERENILRQKTARL